MLAHLNVAYDIAFDKKPLKVNPVMQFLLKVMLKKTVVGEKPYRQNSKTAPYFKIEDDRDFDDEKLLFIENVKLMEQKGEDYFDGKPNPSFGALTAQEWSNLFYKHLEHHFKQFGL